MWFFTLFLQRSFILEIINVSWWPPLSTWALPKKKKQNWQNYLKIEQVRRSSATKTERTLFTQRIWINSLRLLWLFTTSSYHLSNQAVLTSLATADFLVWPQNGAFLKKVTWFPSMSSISHPNAKRSPISWYKSQRFSVHSQPQLSE